MFFIFIFRVRGSTINVLSQIVSHKDEDPDPASLLYGLDKDKNKMMILNALGMTNFLFRLGLLTATKF